MAVSPVFQHVATKYACLLSINWTTNNLYGSFLKQYCSLSSPLLYKHIQNHSTEISVDLH